MKTINQKHRIYKTVLALSEIVIFLSFFLFMWLQSVSCIFIFEYKNTLIDCLVLSWGMSLFGVLPFYFCSYIGKNKLSIIFPLLFAVLNLFLGVELQGSGQQFGILYELRGVCFKYFYFSLIPCMLAIMLYVCGKKQGHLLYFALIGALAHFAIALILQVNLEMQPYSGFSTGPGWLFVSTLVLLEIGLRCYTYKKKKTFLYVHIPPRYNICDGQENDTQN